MGVRDSIGDFFEAVYDGSTSSLGFVSDLAKSWEQLLPSPVRGDPVAGRTISTQFSDRRKSFANDHKTASAAVKMASKPASMALQGLVTGYEYGFARPMSTIQQTSGLPLLQVPGPLGQGLNEVARHTRRPSIKDAWKQSDDTSPGQASIVASDRTLNALTGQDVFTTSYAEAAEMGEQGDEKYSPWFSLASGTADAYLSWYADPLVIAGKGAMLAQRAHKELRASDVDGLKKAWGGTRTRDVTEGGTTPPPGYAVQDSTGRITYHGSSDKIQELRDPAEIGGGSHLLYGPGFYTTASREVASSYKDKAGRSTASDREMADEWDEVVAEMAGDGLPQPSSAGRPQSRDFTTESGELSQSALAKAQYKFDQEHEKAQAAWDKEFDLRMEARHPPTVHSVRWKGENEPNLIDLDRPTSPEFLEVLRRYTPPGGYGDELSDDFIRVNGTPSGADAYQAMSGSAVGFMDGEPLDALLDDLRRELMEKGYDGFKHRGGHIVGRGYNHEVSIYFDTDMLDVAPQARGAFVAGAPETTRTVTDVIKGQVDDLTRRQKRVLKESDDFIVATDGMSPYEIQVALRDFGVNNSAAYADLFSQASGEHALKRLILLSTMGNPEAFAALRVQRAGIADQVARLTKDLDDEVLGLRQANADTARAAGVPQQEIDALLGASPDVVSREARDEINRTLTSYDRAIGATEKLTHSFGSRAVVTPDEIGLFGSAAKNRVRIGKRQRRKIEGATSYTVQDGLAGIPVRIKRAPLNMRPSGWIDFHDADQGVREIEAMTRHARGLDPAERVDMLNRYIAAPDDNARRQVLLGIENRLLHHIGEKHGYDASDIRRLLDHAVSTRDRQALSLKENNFGILSDGTVSHNPLYETQLANGAPTLDIALAYKLLYRNAGRYRALKLAGGKAFDVVVSMGDLINDIWKFEALFRGGYVVRNATDSQLRLIAFLGAQDAVFAQLDNFKAGFKGGRTDLGGPYNAFPDARGVTDDEAAFYNRNLSAVTSYANQMADAHNKILNDLRGTGSWRTALGDDARWNEDYLRVINRHLRQSVITQKLLKGESVDDVTAWLKGDEGRYVRRRMVFGDDSAEALVAAGYENLRHLVPEEFWPQLSRRPFTNDDVEKIWPRDSNAPHLGRPAVNAEQVSFSLGQHPAAQAFWKIRDRYFEVVSKATDDQLGRHPLFRALYRGHARELLMRADPSLKGMLDPADQRIIEEQARLWARTEMKKVMFDVSQKSDLAHFVRFVMPFYAAWQDAITKYGRLIVRDPSLLPRGATLWTAPNDAAFVDVVDADGNPVPSNKAQVSDEEFIRVPAGFAKHFGGQGFTLDISKSSFNIALQGDPLWAPGWGPMGQIPVNEAIKSLDSPTLAGVADELGILPFGVEDAGKLSWKKFLAGSIRQAGLPEARKVRMKALILQQEVFRYQTGERKTDPRTRPGEINDRYNGLVRLRWLTSALSPVSVQYKSPYQFYIDQSHAMDAKYGADPGKADAEFLKQFGEDYFVFRTSLSQDRTHVRPSAQADATGRKYKDLIANNPSFGWLFVGPDNQGEYDRNVYTLQSMRRVNPLTSNTWRDTHDDPIDAFRANNAELGWMQYRNLTTELEAIRIARGLKSMRVKEAADLRQIKSDWLERTIGEDGPAWANDWYDAYNKRDSGSAVRLLRAGRAALDNKTLAKRPDIRTLGEYMAARDEFRKLLVQRKRQGGSGSIFTEANSDLATYWSEITGHLVDKDPIFEDLYTRYLENDDLTKAVN